MSLATLFHWYSTRATCSTPQYKIILRVQCVANTEEYLISSLCRCRCLPSRFACRGVVVISLSMCAADLFNPTRWKWTAACTLALTQGRRQWFGSRHFNDIVIDELPRTFSSNGVAGRGACARRSSSPSPVASHSHHESNSDANDERRNDGDDKNCHWNHAWCLVTLLL